MANSNEVQKVWGVLCLAYPSYAKELSGPDLMQTLKLYQRLLADIPADILEASALQHIASNKWFPTVAELRTLAGNLATAALPDRSGNEAWGLVLDTFTDGGYYRFDDHAITPEFDDPLIGQTLRAMGGYWHLYGCMRDAHGNPAADRARFIECYDTLKRRQREEVLLLPAYRDKRTELAGANALQLTDGKPVSLGALMQGMGLTSREGRR